MLVSDPVDNRSWRGRQKYDCFHLHYPVSSPSSIPHVSEYGSSFCLQYLFSLILLVKWYSSSRQKLDLNIFRKGMHRQDRKELG